MAFDDFDRDDLFGDFEDDNGFDDDFEDDLGEDDFGELGDDFDFGEDDDFGAELDFGDDEEGLDFEDDDFAETGEAGGGPSRGFILIAAIMIIILLGGFALIVAIVTGAIGGESPRSQTETAIALTNQETLLLQAQTETQSALEVIQTETQSAVDAMETDVQATAFAHETETATNIPPTATEDIAATEAAAVELTIAAGDMLASETAAAAETHAFETLNPPTLVTQVPVETEPPADATAPAGESPVPLDAVQMTATALATIFGATPTQEITTPTPIPPADGTPFGTPLVQQQATQEFGTGGALPQTGLFDDIFASSPLTIFLAAFGLLGVIVITRRLRASNRKRKDD